MAVNLTPGAITKISSGECSPADLKPVVQVLNIRKLCDGEKKEGYFVELSDSSEMTVAYLNGIVLVIEVHVILAKCDIIGDPKPYSHKKTSSIEKPAPLVDTGLSNPKEDHADVDPKQPLTSQMMMKKNKEDDMGACFEKLENIGWGTEDPLYDTALLLFGESVDYRKLWLLLKPESCGKWVKNAGSKFGLLG